MLHGHQLIFFTHELSPEKTKHLHMHLSCAITTHLPCQLFKTVEKLKADDSFCFAILQIM